MATLSFKDFKKEKYEKYAEFSGKILIIGYGSVGQAILPVVLRHIVIDPKNITVLERDNHRAIFIKRHGAASINYVRQEITPTNYKKELAKYVGEGDMIINASLNIDAKSLLQWCAENGVMEIDTSLERWEHRPDETIPKLSERTLYHTHSVIRAAMDDYENGPTCCVTHGANPGYVTHTAVHPEKIGTYDLRCAELCGLYHAYMQHKIHVVSQADYEAWLASQGAVKA